MVYGFRVLGRDKWLLSRIVQVFGCGASLDPLVASVLRPRVSVRLSSGYGVPR